MSIRTSRALSLLAACLLCFSAELVAQAPDTWDARRLQLTRTELEQLLQKFEQTRHSASYSNEFRLHASSEAERVRHRLAEGDFQIGDQIEINIAGEPSMPVLTTVGPGRMLPVAGFGEVALAGVLRSELNDHVLKHVGRFLKEPTVRTRANVRILVLGNVRTPGFVSLPAESIVSDLITQAGGPTATAKLAAARVERGSERIIDGQPLQDAIAEGRTLDQLSLRSGDQFFIPAEKSGGLLRAAAIIPTVILAITGLMQIF